MYGTLTAGAFKKTSGYEKGKRQPIVALQIDGKSRAQNLSKNNIME